MTETGQGTHERDGALRAQARAWQELTLAKPPMEPRARELWLQHAAGKILFERVRAAGLAHPDPGLPLATREVAEAAVDHALYALMMLIDGVSPHLRGDGQEVRLKFVVQLVDADGKVEDELDLSAGDGMCMGFHGWRNGDFGKEPVVVDPG
ncbi:MAG TPA: hypothetical protein VHE35_01720 [Kofleriaceae bacterium]|nr:hypothetical protein [Kofleriaceae bacterium]